MAAKMTENSIAVGRIRAFARRSALPHALILSGSGDRLEAARYAAAAMLCSAASTDFRQKSAMSSGVSPSASIF